MKRAISAQVFVLTAGVAIAGMAHAQATDDPIARCRGAGDAKAQIACLEAALRGLETQKPVSPGPAPVPVTPAARPTLPAEPATVPAARPSPSLPDLGSEQVARKKERKAPNKVKSREHFDAPIQSFARNAGDKWVFVLANGQIWRQLQGDPTDAVLREGYAYTANIRRGAVSGYRMSIREIRRTLVVERLR